MLLQEMSLLVSPRATRASISYGMNGLSQDLETAEESLWPTVNITVVMTTYRLALPVIAVSDGRFFTSRKAAGTTRTEIGLS